jgi:hypothetical protein
MPEVWASAAVDRRASPTVAAAPRRGNNPRRETILDSTSEVIFYLLDFEDPVIYLLTDVDLNQTNGTAGAGSSASTKLRMIVPLLHLGHPLQHCHRVTAS